MFLAIDVGNTHTVLGYFHGPSLKKTYRVSTHPLQTADEFKTKLTTLFKLEGIELTSFDLIVVSSVVPPFTV
jgi:type III pantothenate kinase